MPITHEQAHKLIQLEVDRALNTQNSAFLAEHLRECLDCTTYRKEMKEIDGLISPVLRRQGATHAVPLSIRTLVEKNKRRSISTLLTMRTAAISLVMAAMFFTVWQFMLSNPLNARPLPIAPPIPTPASQTAQVTNLTLTLENCESIAYTIRDGDTLSGIAAQFSTSEEQIRAANQLQQAALRPETVLMIPVCRSTPTGTVHPATFTTTLTPSRQFRTSTPGG